MESDVLSHAILMPPNNPLHPTVPRALLRSARRPPGERPAGGPVFRRNAFNRWGQQMNSLLTFIGWLILFVLCWPLALLALVLWPLVWLVSLPFRLVGLTFEALFATLRTVLLLPARVLGYKPKA